MASSEGGSISEIRKDSKAILASKHCFDLTLTSGPKDVVNEKLCEHLRRVWGIPEDDTSVLSGKAVVLDARNLGTSTCLVRHQLFRPSDIIVPNPFEYDLMCDIPSGLEGITLVPSYSGELLARLQAPSSISLLYLDYTCTIDGSKRCRPKSELRSAFSKRIFNFNVARRPVLACTFHIPKDQREDSDMVVETTVKELQTIAKSHRHRFDCVDKFRYENARSSQLMFIIGIISLFSVSWSSSSSSPPPPSSE